MSDASLLIKLGLDTQQLVTGINKSNQLLSGFQNQLKSFSTQIASGLGFVGLGYAVSNAIQGMAEFEHSMSAVKAISGATSDQLKILKQNALEMAAAFSANDIAQFELEMSKMGFTANQVIDVTQAVINLATATGEDLPKSGKIAGQVMNAFGLQSKDMTRITDIMSAALNESTMNLEDFGQAMKYVAPVAKQAGVTLEETSAMLAVLANNGISASTSGTSLRRILTDFTNDGNNASEKLKILAERGMTLSDSFDEVGRTAQSGLAVLANSGTAVDDMVNKINEMNGVTAKQAFIMQNDLAGAWNRLGAAWDRAANSGSTLTGVLKTLIDATSQGLDLATGNKELPKTSMGDALPFMDGLLNFLGFGPSLDDKMKAGANAAAGMKSKIPDIKTTATDPYAYVTPTGMGKSHSALDMSMNADDLSNVTKNLNGVIDGYAEFFGEVDKTNDALELMHEQVSPDVKAAFDEIVTNGAKTKSFLEGFHLSAQRLGYAFINLGAQISNGLAGAISGTITFAQALAQMAISIIDSLERMALAYVIENAARVAALAGPAAPFVLGGLIAVGSGILKAAFMGTGGGNISGGGASGGGGSIRTNQSVALEPGQFKISGRDLVYAYDKNKALNPYAVGGG